MTDYKNPGPVEQVSTDVADEMVRRLFADGGPEPDERILFPSVGHGEFVDAVSRHCDRHGLEFPEAVALEAREGLVGEIRERFDEPSLKVRHLDFLASLPHLGEFNYILGDPPVARLRGLSPEIREDLAMRFDTISITEQSRDEDLYLAFFERGLAMLAPEGRLVFLTPDFTSKHGHSAVPDLKRRLTTFQIEDIDASPIESPFEQVELDVVITTVTHAEPDPEYASKVDFDGVQEALTVPYDIGVVDIMTQDPMSFYPDDNVHDVYLSLERNNYDAAPVRARDNKQCIGLVSKAELTGADAGTLADNYINEIDESQLIPITSPFDETLNQLRQQRFCLVGAKDDVRGIVTRFDLNSMEVYFHLYVKFARFEIGLRNTIRDYGIDWEDALMDAGISWKRVKELREEYSEKSEVTQDVLDTLLLSDLIKIVENSTIQEEIGLNQPNLGVRLSTINNLRTPVAHYQPLIHTMDTTTWTKQRTLRDFSDIYKALNRCLKKFETRNYA